MPIAEPVHHQNFTARMMEICSTRAPWHRRLWRAGTLQIARELLDGSVRPGTPEAAIADQRSYVLHCIQTDRGIADHGQAVARTIKEIKPGITTSSHAWICLREHIDRHDEAYLRTWADALDATPASNRPIDVEGAVRRITAYILDSGMDKSSLYAWLRAIRDDPSATLTIGDFLREVDLRLRQAPRMYTFCVPVQTTPRFNLTAASGWMTATATTQWRKANAPKASGVSQQGSFLLEVWARDINAAADAARAKIANLATKLQLGAKKPVLICASMWSKEKGSELPTQATNRVINVHAFERLGQLQELDMLDYITNTLALVQSLRTGPPHVAVVNGWAAIESLMVGPSDQQDVVAAHRFSLIVAASMIRAELSWLSRSYAQSHDGAEAQAMRACDENIDRAKLFQVHAQSNPQMTLNGVDNLALERIRPALSNPRAEVEKITAILTREFVRLYRKRNMIVHGGQTQDGSLHSLSETLAPLIGAGVDRVVHVGLKFKVRPVELSAIVESRLHYLVPAGSTDPGNLLEMLEF